MKQGIDFVYVKVTLSLIKAMDDGWSRPVRVKIEEYPNGDIDMIVKEAAGNGS